MEVFANRREAGRRLAERLRDEPRIVAADRLVVLGIPRGGLPVGAEVANHLGAPLDVALVRSLRTPSNPELSFGSVDADGHVEIDRSTVERLGISEEQIEAEVAERRDSLAQRLELYRAAMEWVELAQATVVVVDDGIATGGTAARACRYARRAGAAEVIVATPVAPPGVEERLGDVVDDVVVLVTPPEFLAVAQVYEEYPTLDDPSAVAAARLAAHG